MRKILMVVMVFALTHQMCVFSEGSNTVNNDILKLIKDVNDGFRKINFDELAIRRYKEKIEAAFSDEIEISQFHKEDFEAFTDPLKIFLKNGQMTPTQMEELLIFFVELFHKNNQKVVQDEAESQKQRDERTYISYNKDKLDRVLRVNHLFSGVNFDQSTTEKLKSMVDELLNEYTGLPSDYFLYKTLSRSLSSRLSLRMKSNLIDRADADIIAKIIEDVNLKTRAGDDIYLKDSVGEGDSLEKKLSLSERENIMRFFDRNGCNEVSIKKFIDEHQERKQHINFMIGYISATLDHSEKINTMQKAEADKLRGLLPKPEDSKVVYVFKIHEKTNEHTENSGNTLDLK